MDGLLQSKVGTQLKNNVAVGWDNEVLMNLNLLKTVDINKKDDNYPIHPSVMNLILKDLIHSIERAVHLIREIQRGSDPVININVPPSSDGQPLTIAHAKGLGSTILNSTKKMLVQLGRNKKQVSAAQDEILRLQVYIFTS